MELSPKNIFLNFCIIPKMYELFSNDNNSDVIKEKLNKQLEELLSYRILQNKSRKQCSDKLLLKCSDKLTAFDKLCHLDKKNNNPLILKYGKLIHSLIYYNENMQNKINIYINKINFITNSMTNGDELDNIFILSNKLEKKGSCNFEAIIKLFKYYKIVKIQENINNLFYTDNSINSISINDIMPDKIIKNNFCYRLLTEEKKK